ncbi:serine/arginine repetitive matrix protein 1-like [Ptychodera flava]|uniref:serine/arginine repetitive matrix protein 1-like n=1 Tax=Ptychodera flava TaxID=63121 RepID=UPI003969DEFA
MKSLSVDIKRISGMKSDSPPVRSNALAIPGSNENGVSPATSRSPSPAPSAFLALPADRSPRSRSPSPSPRSRSDNDSHAKTTNGADSPRQRRHGSEILPLYLNTSDTSPSRSPSLSRKISTSSLSSSPQGSVTPVPSKSPLLHRKALQEPNLKHSYDSLLPSNSSNTSLNLLSRQQRVLSRSLEVLNSDKDAVRVAKRSISTVTPPSLTPSALSPATSTSSLHFSRSGSLDRSIDGQINTPPRHTPSSSPKTERRPSEWSDMRRRSSSWGTTRNKPTIVVENVTEKVTKIPMHKKHTAATRKKSIGPAHFFIQALDLQSPAEPKVAEEQYPPMLLPPVYTQTTRQLTPRDFSIRPVTPTFTGEEMENMKGVRYLRTPNNGESDFIDPFDFSV